MLLRQCPFLLKVLLIEQVVVFLYQRCLPLSSKLRGCKILRPDGQHSGNHQCGLASFKFYGPITANNKDVLKSLIHKAI